MCQGYEAEQALLKMLDEADERRIDEERGKRSKPMVERIEMFRAADGTLYETEEEAFAHDSKNALTAQAKAYLIHQTKYKGLNVQTRISVNKVEDLLVDFAYMVLFESDKLYAEPAPSDGPGPTPEA